jgi:hypothetical protein
MDQNTNWVIVDITDIISKVTGGITHRITFANATDIAHTFVSQSMSNYSYWQNVISLHKNGWGFIINNLSVKSKINKNPDLGALMNADSKFKIQHKDTDRTKIINILDDMVRQEFNKQQLNIKPKKIKDIDPEVLQILGIARSKQ